jgi:hypothetical protein
MNNIWCNVCGSDTEGAHYGSCSEHPNVKALAGRYGIPRKQANPETSARPTNRTTSPAKNSWFSGKSTIEFDEAQTKKVLEYFIQNVLEIQDVEVVDFSHRAGSIKVTFQQVEVVEEPVSLPAMSADELEALNAMVSEGKID